MTDFDLRLPDMDDIFAMAGEILVPTPHPLAGKPVEWVKERLCEWLSYDQRQILESVQANRYTAVKSCHDVGKSFTAARAACYWLDTYPAGEAFVVTTAPTWSQVRLILWREMGKAHRKGKLQGRITGDAEWKLHWGNDGTPDEPVATGKKPADYDMAAFQGIHARYVLVIVDEACGVSKSIFDGVDALSTNRNARVLAIGNPDDPSSHFAQICQPGSGWNVLQINALESPNFTQEEVQKYPRVAELMRTLEIPFSIEYVPEEVRELYRDLLVDPGWVDERIKRWGIESPLFVSKVFGEFPKVSIDALFEPGWVMRAGYNELVPDRADSSVGVDVARFGDDKTIMYLREGGVYRLVFESGKTAVTQTAGRVEFIVNGHPARPVAQVDDVGVGGGVVDILVEDGYEVRPLVGSSAATERMPNGKLKFNNLRSQWYWTLRELFRNNLVDIDPEDKELAAQLTNIKYTVNRQGQICVETKEKMRERGVDSPDRADALCYAAVQGAITGAGLLALEHHANGSGITGDLMTADW